MDTIVIIPTYNERETIEQIIKKVWSVTDAEVVVVDDSSPDGTGDIVQALQEQYQNLMLIRRPEKQGIALAYVEGMQYALGKQSKYIVQMDGDFSHEPCYLEHLLDKAKESDLVIGSKYTPGGRVEGLVWWRKMLSRFGNIYACSLLKLRDSRFSLKDATSGYVCWQSDMLRQIDFSSIRCKGYGFQIELKWQACKYGARISEVPIVFCDRLAGKSKITQHIFWECLVLPFRLLVT